MNYSGSIKIGNIGLNVSDIEISKAFYQEILGPARERRVTSSSTSICVDDTGRQDSIYAMGEQQDAVGKLSSGFAPPEFCG
jgi:catechol 2,3-dioxygenase-like lactoylglutathione lyase family enzyme